MNLRSKIAAQTLWRCFLIAAALATTLPHARSESGAGTPGVKASPTPATNDASKSEPTTEVACGGPTPPYAPELVEVLTAAALREGDAKNGANVFRSAKFACRSCHRIGDSGAQLGPDLSNVGRLRTPAQIVESLLWPSRQVDPAFVSTMVLTVEGVAYNGFVSHEDEETLRLFDVALQREVELPLADVEARQTAGSIMPENIVGGMTNIELVDLISFLMSLNGDVHRIAAFAQGERPAPFSFSREPLSPEQWPNRFHHVNRERVYDYYAKQADYFSRVDRQSTLLPEYPGLDGGVQGHWGNQSEDDWRDDRWNAVDVGNVLAGVFHGPNGSVPKGICVRLGDQGELSACFNPQTLRYEALWRNGFLRFSDVRHGFLDGLLPAGEMLPPPADGAPAESFAYHGYYRFGPRVVFAYRLGATEFLDSPWHAGGEFRREVAPVESHSLKAALQGGHRQWPQQIRVDGALGKRSPYAIDTIPLPVANPWRMPIFCGDHAFLQDGSALVCTMHGDVWKSSPLDESLQGIVWTRFASGLHQPLGMLVEDDQIYVMGRDQLTRLHDLNDDGEADFYECVSNKVETSPSGHDYVCGLARDAQGNFYTASSNQGVIRIGSNGEATSLAQGLRNPDGVHLTTDGAITVPASEGEWTPASMICLVPANRVASPVSEPPLHFGYGGPRDGETPSLPLIYLPRGADNSSGSQATVPDNRWGPLQGKMIHLSFGAANHFLLLRDRVGDQEQGAVVPLMGDFNSGVHRAKFNPRDGQLYVSGMNGWGSYAAEDSCLQRVRYTGAPVQLPTEFHVHENGVLVRFAQPVDPTAVAQAERHFAQAWNYRYSGGYGSPEFSTQLENIVGHDRLAIAPHVLDEHAVFFEIPELQRVNTLHLSMGVDAKTTCQMFVTVHETDVPFTEFVGYAPTRKTERPHPIVGDLAAMKPPTPNPWQAPIDGARSVELQTGHGLSFAPNVIEAKSNEPLRVTLKNGDVVPHNWVLIKSGSLAAIGASADKLVSTPDAARGSYVPAGEEVIAHTNVVNPGNEFAIYFHAPEAPGNYPFICTFPGHWKAMQGTLIVK